MKRQIGVCGRALYTPRNARVYYCNECEGYHLAKDRKPKKK